jgi:hypothetical protein
LLLHLVAERNKVHPAESEKACRAASSFVFHSLSPPHQTHGASIPHVLLVAVMDRPDSSFSARLDQLSSALNQLHTTLDEARELGEVLLGDSRERVDKLA